MSEQRLHATARSAIGGESIAPLSVRSALRRLTYDPWDAASGRHAVPRVFLKRLPDDIAMSGGRARAQKLFVTMMLPVVLRANEIVSLQRSMIRAGADEETMRQAMWQLDAKDPDQLDRRFDVMPPSLIIALAAAATRWGRDWSGPANMFPDALVTPAELPPSVARAADGLRRTNHSDLLGPVLDVIQGLNTVEGGEAMRRERARQRMRRKFDGYRLALLLEPISSLSPQIVRETLYAIEGAALSRLDEARLEAPGRVFH